MRARGLSPSRRTRLDPSAVSASVRGLGLHVRPACAASNRLAPPLRAPARPPDSDTVSEGSLSPSRRTRLDPSAVSASALIVELYINLSLFTSLRAVLQAHTQQQMLCFHSIQTLYTHYKRVYGARASRSSRIHSKAGFFSAQARTGLVSMSIFNPRRRKCG